MIELEEEWSPGMGVAFPTVLTLSLGQSFRALKPGSH